MLLIISFSNDYHLVNIYKICDFIYIYTMDSFKDYVEKEIIPRYASFDAAHREDHVRSVIEKSQKLARFYDVNPEIIYLAAAYHDLGLCEGREQHHMVSGRIIREDKNLSRWFSREEIELAAQAAEDHRASGKNPPRINKRRTTSTSTI